jgi:hypothetical protein
LVIVNRLAGSDGSTGPTIAPRHRAHERGRAGAAHEDHRLGQLGAAAAGLVVDVT